MQIAFKEVKNYEFEVFYISNMEHPQSPKYLRKRKLQRHGARKCVTHPQEPQKNMQGAHSQLKRLQLHPTCFFT